MKILLKKKNKYDCHGRVRELEQEVMIKGGVLELIVLEVGQFWRMTEGRYGHRSMFLVWIKPTALRRNGKSECWLHPKYECWKLTYKREWQHLKY
jgi:hypothetical protein